MLSIDKNFYYNLLQKFIDKNLWTMNELNDSTCIVSIGESLCRRINRFQKDHETARITLFELDLELKGGFVIMISRYFSMTHANLMVATCPKLIVYSQLIFLLVYLIDWFFKILAEVLLDYLKQLLLYWYILQFQTVWVASWQLARCGRKKRLTVLLAKSLSLVHLKLID